MSNQEQQQDEIEALQSIYPDEFELISDVSPVQYKLNIPLVPTDNFDDDDDNGDEVPRVEVHVSIPDDYPEDASPSLSLQSTDIKRDLLDQLSDFLRETCEENSGDVVIFTLIQSAQEWYEEHLESQQEDKDDQDSNLNRHMTDQEAKFSTDAFVGTPVTKDNFVEWKNKFDAEMAQLREEQHKKRMSKGAKQYGKLSGRQHFEQKDSKWMESLEEKSSTVEEKATEEHIDDDLFLDDDEWRCHTMIIVGTQCWFMEDFDPSFDEIL